MVEAARKMVQAAVIDTIKKKHKVNYAKIGESVDVHRSHIQKVANGSSALSDKRFELLCKTWDIDVNEITRTMELDNLQLLRWKTLKKIIEIRKIDLNDLHLQTGISPFELNHIMQGKKDLPDEYVDIISKVLDVDSYIVGEGRIAILLEMITKGLWSINVDRSAIEAVITFLESQI